uniref:Uncharacterized protein n=1 Tax=candidate division WOR-3 bacterium TaxID=2052148 RepID=A0A7V4E2T2_UNCW3
MEKKEIKINKRDLLFVLQKRLPEIDYFLDLEKGEIIPVFEITKEDFLKMKNKFPQRFYKLKPFTSTETFFIVRNFINLIKDSKIKEEILANLEGKISYKKFKEVLKKYQKEWQEWLIYERNELLNYFKKKIEEKFPIFIQFE